MAQEYGVLGPRISAEKTNAALLQSRYPNVPYLAVYSEAEKLTCLQSSLRHGMITLQEFNSEKGELHARLAERNAAYMKAQRG